MSDHKHSPDPLRNHGYTDICSCGLRLHRDPDFVWVADYRVTAYTPTMEDAARICCPPKLPTPLITREPCESCKDADTETDTGAFRCRASMSGVPECESYRAVRELEDIIVQVAALYRRVGNKEMRKSMAGGAFDGYDEALWVQGVGAELDKAAFMDLCGCGRDAS